MENCASMWARRDFQTLHVQVAQILNKQQEDKNAVHLKQNKTKQTQDAWDLLRQAVHI